MNQSQHSLQLNMHHIRSIPTARHLCEVAIFASYMAHYLHSDKFLSQIDTKMKLETALAKFKVDIDFENMYRNLALASNTLLLDIS